MSATCTWQPRRPPAYLNISAGAQFHGFLWANTDGQITVTGQNSYLDVFGQAVYLDGNFNVLDGAQAFTPDAIISSYEAYSPTATVSGNGAVWSNAGRLVVGLVGTASRNILDGAVLNTGSAFLAEQAGSHATATVSGATWNIASDL